MSKYVHKNGRVHRVFTTPFSDWNQVPEDDFPNTLICENEAQLRAQIGNDYILIDRPASPSNQAVEPSPLPVGALLSTIASMDIPQEAKDALIAKHRGESGSIVHQIAEVRENTDYQDKMLQEFRLVLASIGNAYNPQEVEAIGNFILAVDPSLEAELVRIKQRQTTRRFTLG